MARLSFMQGLIVALARNESAHVPAGQPRIQEKPTTNQSSTASNKVRRGAIMRLTLSRIGGMDSRLVNGIDFDRRFYASTGTAIMFAAVLAAFSALLVVEPLDLQPIITALVALVWGLVVFNAVRGFTLLVRRRGTSARTAVGALPGFLYATVIALATATLITLTLGLSVARELSAAVVSDSLTALVKVVVFLAVAIVEILPVTMKLLRVIGTPGPYEMLEEAQALTLLRKQRLRGDLEQAIEEHAAAEQLRLAKAANEKLVAVQYELTTRTIDTWARLAGERMQAGLDKWYDEHAAGAGGVPRPTLEMPATPAIRFPRTVPIDIDLYA